MGTMDSNSVVPFGQYGMSCFSKTLMEDFTSVSNIFLFGFGIVPTVWYVFLLLQNCCLKNGKMNKLTSYQVRRSDHM
jgi:hypothetical protein